MSTIKSSTEHLTLNADGTGKDIKLQANGSEKVIIKSDGKVGIGTSSPSAKLDVAGASGISVKNNYAHMGSTVSGAMAIFGHNIKTDSSSANVVTSANTGYHSSMMKMYYNEGITFHSISTTATAGDTFYAPGATNELVRIQNGGGISFNGDTAAANALDDYEEGTWTPTFGSGSSIDNVVGTYTKIGNRVSVQLNLENGTLAGATTATMGGLPYAVYGDRSATSSVNHYKLFPYDSVQGLALPNTTTIVFLHARANAAWYSANFSNGVNRYLTFTATYRTS